MLFNTKMKTISETQGVSMGKRTESIYVPTLFKEKTDSECKVIRRGLRNDTIKAVLTVKSLFIKGKTKELNDFIAEYYAEAKKYYIDPAHPFSSNFSKLDENTIKQFSKLVSDYAEKSAKAAKKPKSAKTAKETTKIETKVETKTENK